VVGGPGADQGGNPLQVAADDLGWGWVEVDAGAERVAVVRHGGLVSWALLNVAPEPIERPMDLGLGPLADLVWAWLPAARLALMELAITELDAAILEDRSPWAVPGSAVAAVLPGPVRELSDRGPDSVAAVGRLLRRLIEVDARTTGRHRGEIAKALRWMTAEPYRSVFAAADPRLLALLHPAEP